MKEMQGDVIVVLDKYCEGEETEKRKTQVIEKARENVKRKRGG